jgi:hypothetical protein
MGNVLQGKFGEGLIPNENKFIEDLDPLLEEMVDVCCNSYGEELGCLMIDSLCLSLEKIKEKLCDKVEIYEKYILTMENGDIIDFVLENNE